MRLMAILWFVAAFLAGACLFLVTHPIPAMNALVMDLKGVGLFERCRQAGACGTPAPPEQRAPKPPQIPPDVDRA